jgi:integrase
VSAKTYERYAEIVRDNLVPGLGQYPLAKLQPIHIQGFYSAALQAPRKDRRKREGLSPRAVVHFHRILREALAQAVTWQLLAQNPAGAVEPPRPDEPEMKALDEERVRSLLAAARDTSMYLLMLVAPATGVRRGELLALKWEDLDLAAGTMQVRRSQEGPRASSPSSSRKRRVAGAR